MVRSNTNRVIRELNEDGFKIRLTFIQDEMTIHMSHKSGTLSKTQEKIVTQRIMDAALKDHMATSLRKGRFLK